MDLNEVASQLEKKAVASRSFGGVIKAGEYAAWAKGCKAIAEEHYASLRAEKKAFMGTAANFLSGAYNQASDALKQHVSSPLAHRALMGAGLGAGGGALLGLGSNLVSGRKKKNYLSDMLHYGLIGGLGGGAAGGLYELANNPKAIENLVGAPAAPVVPPAAPEAAPPADQQAAPPEAKKEKAPEVAPPVAAAPAPEAKPKLDATAPTKQKIEANETFLGRLGNTETEDVVANTKNIGIAGAVGAAGGAAAGRATGAGGKLLSDAFQRDELRGLKGIPLTESKGFQEAFLNNVKDIQAKATGAGNPVISGKPVVTNYQQAQEVAKHIIQNPSSYGISGDPIEAVMQFEKAKGIAPKSVLGALGHDTDIAKSLRKTLETGDTATRLKALEKATETTRNFLGYQSGKLPSVMLDEPYLNDAQKSFRKTYGPGSSKGFNNLTDLSKRLLGSGPAKTLGRWGGRGGALVGAGAVLTDILTNIPRQNGQIVSEYIQDIISKNKEMSIDTFKTLQDFSSTASKGLSKLDASAMLDQISKLGK